MTTVTLKVLAGAGEDRAIWSVDIQPTFQSSRLCGAWMNPGPEDLSDLLRGQPLLTVGASPEPAELRCRHIDLGETHQALVESIDQLAALNRASRTPKGNRRAPLPRPKVPAIPEDIHASGGKPPHGFVNPSPAAISAVRAAHYLAALADAWAKVETLRLSRDYLRADTTDHRQFPVKFSADSKLPTASTLAEAAPIVTG
ncbi:hypothetical protein GCM10027169_20420 [Gordonia jinhuaensis]|uniref:Uncharacterized protein n=1 Tax=Gordonia jinhuaensis TaxID=1517702 RepID=A0A916WYL5_9ACTN|nr:hypothetical protein [Gordonia jinhuaensis]GGB43927.1 hypothetical protein GCM10011489_34320 [Gordonia jinhuaensis]